MKFYLHNFLIFGSLFIVGIQIESNQAQNLLYLIPKRADSSYTLNERNSFTNKLVGGWIFDADQEIDVLVYLLVDNIHFNIKSSQNVNDYDLNNDLTSFIYFTTNDSNCNKIRGGGGGGKVSDEFKLTYIKERSRLSLSNSANSLLVAEASIKFKHSSDKYYTCLNLSSTYPTVHQGTKNIFTHIITTKELLPIYLVVVIYFLLLCLSALFSGLNLGLMSLDLTELNLLQRCGSKKEKTYAKKIYPLRAKGNQLLCTILLGNVLVNSSSTLILGNYIQGIFAAVGSTLLIVLFGEIIPQSACSRYGLAVGAYTRHVTYLFIGLTFVVSYPLGKLLNFFLGKEIALSLSRDKVRELMRQARDGKDIEDKQFKLLSGALDFKTKLVKDRMVPIKDVFSLDINSILDFDTFKKILYHGYSRIPVYEDSMVNFIGLILIQDLLLNDPADKVPLRAVMDYYKHPIPKCKLSDSLELMFDKFRKGDSHMAFVYNDDANLAEEHIEVVGILTLENIIEELVQSEIMDEADNKRERRRKSNIIIN